MNSYNYCNCERKTTTYVKKLIGLRKQSIQELSASISKFMSLTWMIGSSKGLIEVSNQYDDLKHHQMKLIHRSQDYSLMIDI